MDAHKRRAFQAPPDDQRCRAGVTTTKHRLRIAADGTMIEGARCMHRAVRGAQYCRQHAAARASEGVRA